MQLKSPVLALHCLLLAICLCLESSDASPLQQLPSIPAVRTVLGEVGIPAKVRPACSHHIRHQGHIIMLTQHVALIRHRCDDIGGQSSGGPPRHGVHILHVLHPRRRVPACTLVRPAGHADRPAAEQTEAWCRRSSDGHPCSELTWPQAGQHAHHFQQRSGVSWWCRCGAACAQDRLPVQVRAVLVC